MAIPVTAYRSASEERQAMLTVVAEVTESIRHGITVGAIPSLNKEAMLMRKNRPFPPVSFDSCEIQLKCIKQIIPSQTASAVAIFNTLIFHHPLQSLPAPIECNP